MKISKSKLKEIIKEEIIKELGSSYGRTPSPGVGDFGSHSKLKTYTQKYSSKEAKNVIDTSLKNYSKLFSYHFTTISNIF